MITIIDTEAQLEYRWTTKDELIVERIKDQVIIYSIKGCISFLQALNFYKQIIS